MSNVVALDTASRLPEAEDTDAANPQAASAIADRFADALARGLWVTRRNSVEPLLQSRRGVA